MTRLVVCRLTGTNEWVKRLAGLSHVMSHLKEPTIVSCLPDTVPCPRNSQELRLPGELGIFTRRRCFSGFWNILSIVLLPAITCRNTHESDRLSYPSLTYFLPFPFSCRGNFGTVRRATHKETGIMYAAKFLRRRRRATCWVKQIQHEIAVLMLSSGSKQIVKLHAVYETRNEFVLILEM